MGTARSRSMRSSAGCRYNAGIPGGTIAGTGTAVPGTYAGFPVDPSLGYFAASCYVPGTCYRYVIYLATML